MLANEAVYKKTYCSNKFLNPGYQTTIHTPSQTYLDTLKAQEEAAAKAMADLAEKEKIALERAHARAKGKSSKTKVVKGKVAKGKPVKKKK